MKDLMERVEPLLEDHIRNIVLDVEERSGFRCPQQLHDLKDSLSALKKAMEISKMAV